MNEFPHLIHVVDPNNNISQPAIKGDVGYDVIAASDPKIVGVKDEFSRGGYRSIDYIEYDLNIKADGFQPPESSNEDVFTLIFPRSSISKYNLVLANSIGLIDSGFRSTFKVRFKYIFQPEDLNQNDLGGLYCVINFNKIYNKGDKICQLVFQKHFHPLIKYATELEQSQRDQGGFGSTSPQQ